MADLGCYKDQYGDLDLPVAREVARKVLCLPLYNGLSLDDVRRIAGLVKSFAGEK